MNKPHSSFKLHIFDLPFDVLDLIMTNLRDSDLKVLSTTCKYMNQMVKEHYSAEASRLESKKRRKKELEIFYLDESEDEEYDVYHYTGDGYHSDYDEFDNESLLSFGSNHPEDDDDEHHELENEWAQ